ncbi:hypothetical protein KY290_036224 [Solanum tuberosum]|uniref:Uncharacterized protein n=1 Tax=Solanum tuberosum TaxID=4113 RepID=A0ABQ7TTF0_SOLTU|nr:hypothetical protein KY290_036224 [Solanum tuberosum]
MDASQAISSCLPSSSNTGTRRGARSGYKKRPRVVGQGVFVTNTGYTCINQGLSSSRRINTGVQSSAHVTDQKLLEFKQGHKPRENLPQRKLLSLMCVGALVVV